MSGAETAGKAQTTSKAAAAIDRARAQGRAALIAYLPAGYPSVEESIAAGIAAARNGADCARLWNASVVMAVSRNARV